jgi:NAD(P)-dependent dehydrogenase (short-subunit alcohol dehydrogenase family)
MGFDGNGWIARRFCPRSSSRGANAGAQNQRENAIYHVSAHTPRNLPHYSATKAGQTMIVKELARALGADGIRVNAIAPGAIPGGGFDADTTTLQRMIPLGRTGTPDDIADMAVALLCDRFSRYVTDYGCGGWRTLALQLDSVPDSRLEANENPASDIWCSCRRSRACGFHNV